MEKQFSKIEWQAQESPSFPRSRELITALGIIAAGFLIFGILTKNFLFILIIILIGFVLYLQKQKGIETIDVFLDQDGITINEKLYSFENFESFWIFGEEHKHGRELALRGNKRLMPLLLVPLAQADTDTIRSFLLKRLPEQEEKESLIDLLRKAFF